MKPQPATLDVIDGRPTLRFERLLDHPPEKVWRAVTEPDELAQWFPARVETELRVGASMVFVFEDAPLDQTPGGEIIELDPPKVFAYRWGEDVLRWEILPEDGGCRLLFTHALSQAHGGAAAAARNAAGWDECLAALTARLDQRLPSRQVPMPHRIEDYVERFGLGRGEIVEGSNGWVLRFVRDLVWNPPERAWAALTGGAAVAVGQPPPYSVTVDGLEAGAVTAAAEPNLLEYDWLDGGARAGRVRWEITADPLAGTRLVLIQTVPSRLPQVPPAVLPAWQERLNRYFADLFTDGQPG
ncbi:MAG TPA: SRPBCC family protein [Pseudonocardiaceae bacterium]|nr:SRPBCC family protein [Pseudonocardiaceae bacterium]